MAADIEYYRYRSAVERSLLTSPFLRRRNSAIAKWLKLIQKSSKQ
jgi:hypothetical protein